jgi:hypothetical protein
MSTGAEYGRSALVFFGWACSTSLFGDFLIKFLIIRALW